MIETERLTLIPLRAEELGCYLEGEGRLEARLQLSNSGRTVSPEVRKRVNELMMPRLLKMTEDEALFLTFWLVVEKQTRSIVAELGFKGKPDRIGSVEIGYGTLPSQRKKGYMTEAVAGMIRWAKTRPDIHRVLAETDKDNLASKRVLEKNHFETTERVGRLQGWRIDVS
jgi:ribosomal-protein-alanine N-acetyltransferase